MNGVNNKLHAAVHSSRKAWIEHRKSLKKLERLAEQKPAAAAFAFEIAAEELRSKAVADLYYFSVISPQARYLRKLEVCGAQAEEPYNPSTGEVDPSRPFSLEFDEEMGTTLAALQRATYQWARINMSIAGEESRAAGNGYYGPAVCEAFLRTVDEVPAVFAGFLQEKWNGDHRVRDMAVSSLAGWVGARISLSPNRRHTRVLDEGSEVSALDQLVQMLPGAVIIEWAALDRGESPTSLTSRVENHLEATGSLTAALDRKGKLDQAGYGTLGGSLDYELEEFERQETLRQQLNALPRWVEKAKLAERERQVYDLDREMRRDTEAIARRMGIDPATVRGLRKRYTDKLRKAAGL